MADFPALPFWTDAYISDTAHLTNEEHGVYLRLLMFAWRSSGCCLPDNDKRLALMVGLSLKKWLAIRPTIAAFWVIENSVWTQKRLTKERKYVTGLSTSGRNAAEARWSANRLKNQDTVDAVAPERHMPERCADDATQTHTQSQQVKEEDTSVSSKKKTASRGTRLDADWFLPVSWGQWAVSEGWSPDDLRIEADKFRDYWHSKAGPTAVKMDWQATWRNWIRSAAQNKPKHTNGTRHERKSFDAAINATADMLSAGTIRLDNSSRDPFAVRPRGNA